MKIGFVGLGSLGQAMATNLLKSGHELWVWNRLPAPVEAMVELGAKAAADLQQAFTTSVKMPTAELVRENLLDVMAHGEGDMDLMVLAQAAERRAKRGAPL